MKKILSAILCAVLLLGSLSVMPAMPVSAAGETGGLDYSLLLDLSGGASFPVELNFDGLTFNGTLSRSGVPDEEREKIIEDVLKKMKLTREDIGNAHKVVNLVRSKKSWGEILQETRKTFEKMLGVNGVGDVADAIIFDTFLYDGSEKHQAIQKELRTNEVQAYQISAPEAAGAAISAAEKIAKLKGKQLLTEIFTLAGKGAETPVNVITTMWDAMRADQKRTAEKTASYAMREVIYEFYNEVNHRISVQDWKNDWKINIDDADGRDFSFCGVSGCRQTFTVNMSLTNKGSSLNSYPNGVFKGTAQITIEHDMSPFDSELLKMMRTRPTDSWYGKLQQEALNKGIHDYSRYELSALDVLEQVSIHAADWKIEGASMQIVEPNPKTTITRTLTKNDFTVELSGFGKDNNFNVFYPVFDGFESELALASTHEYKMTNPVEGADHIYGTDNYHEYVDSIHLMLDGPNGDVRSEKDFSRCVIGDQGLMLYGNNLLWAADIPKAMKQFGEYKYKGTRNYMYPIAELWDNGIWEKWDSENKFMSVDLKGMK